MKIGTKIFLGGITLMIWGIILILISKDIGVKVIGGFSIGMGFTFFSEELIRQGVEYRRLKFIKLRQRRKSIK